jgi:hypothetical protein
LTLPPFAFASDGEICLRVSSQDGIYSTTALYQIEGQPQKHAVRLPYPSRHEEVIRNFPADAIAIAATPGLCGKASNDYIVAGATGADSKEPVRIYVNGMDANEVFVRTEGEGGWSSPSKCKKVKSAQQRAYEFRCIVDAPALGTLQKVQVLRERWGRPQPTVEFRIAGGAR